MTTPAIRFGYAVVVAFIACVSIAGSSVAYANYVQRESDRKWCKLVTTLDDAYRGQPPTTAAGKNVAESIAQLRRDLGCPTT
jgi:hypothetical protein